MGMMKFYGLIEDFSLSSLILHIDWKKDYQL